MGDGGMGDGVMEGQRSESVVRVLDDVSSAIPIKVNSDD